MPLLRPLLWMGLVACAACGGRTLELPEGTSDPAKTAAANENTDGAAPAPSASATSSPSGPSAPSQPGGDPFPICPARAPSAGDSCETQNQGCAYVDYQAGTCVSFTCDANGKWQSSTPAGC